MSGAVLTFFAFVGFEDMLNVSEEVKNPERTMPWGIVIALAAATLLYIAIAVTAVSVVRYEDLAAAPAPLAAITGVAAPWLPGWVFRVVTMFAVANTVLINYIMGSRLLYGMARQGLVPAALGRVHARRRTPHVAILTLLVIVSGLALAGGVADLGTATGLLLLCCFVVVNGALIVLKRRPGEPPGQFEVPLVVPALGVLVCGALVVARLTSRNAQGRIEWKAPLIAAALLAGIVLLYAVVRPRNVSPDSAGAPDMDVL
jgi:amino acid transporter